MLILRILSYDEMYGYKLVETIQRQSDNVLQFREGCLYPILHKLAEEGLLLTRNAMVNGRPRYYYRTSAKGLKQLQTLSTAWRDVVKGTEAILGANYAT